MKEISNRIVKTNWYASCKIVLVVAEIFLGQILHHCSCKLRRFQLKTFEMIIESEFCLFYFANCKIISVILRSLFFQKTVNQLTETLSLFLLRIKILKQFVMINEDLVCFTLLEAKPYPLSSKVCSSEKFC